MDDGMQCFASPKPNWELTFKVPAKMLPAKKTYKMSLRFNTVHAGDVLPFNVTVNKREYQLPFQMKWENLGLWQTTEPVEVELGGSDELLVLTRKEKKHPCSIKSILLTPV